MTDHEKSLVKIFMDAQAQPAGRLFSENVLAGIKAVLAHVYPEVTWSAVDERAAWLEGMLKAFMVRVRNLALFQSDENILKACDYVEAELQRSPALPPQEDMPK